MSKVAILLPAYNEALQISEQIDSIFKKLQDLSSPFQIIVVDDGSTDDTAIKVLSSNDKNIRLISHEVNKGLGEAMKTGIDYFLETFEEGDLLIVMDADNTHDTDLIPEMFSLIKSGGDIVIASRYQKGSKLVGLSKFREFLSWGASLFFRLLHPIQNVKDYSCGYRAYSYSVLSELKKKHKCQYITEQGFSCMSEILVKSGRITKKITEIPMVLRYDRKLSSSKMRIAKTILSTVKFGFANFLKKS